MSLFEKLIKRNKKLEARHLNLTDYEENRETVDLLAEKMFKDLLKINKRTESLNDFLKFREKEFGVQEHNYCHLRVLSGSKEYAERISKLIRFFRVNVLSYTLKELSKKEQDKMVVDLTEIKRLIIHSTLKLFNVEKAKDVEWCGEFDVYSQLDIQETKLIEIVNKLLQINSYVSDAIVNKCTLNQNKVLDWCKVGGITEKRIPRVL